MKILWRNGTFTEDGFTDSGFLEGSGVFETLRCEGGRVFALHRHMRRALHAGRSLGIALPKEEIIESAIAEVLHKADLPLARLRAQFAHNNFALTYEPYIESNSPIRVRVDGARQVKARVLKSYPYDDRLDLLNQSLAMGYGEVLLANDGGFITEGAVSNFLFRDEESWFTTPLSHGIVPGVMRALYVEKLGIHVRPFSITDISLIQAGFAISSLRLGQRISHLGSQELNQSEAMKRECDELLEKMRQAAWDSSVLLTHG